jgi:hypothetical protein
MEFTFKDNSKVSDINAIPEKYRGLYAPVEGEEGVHALTDAAKGLVADYLGVSETLAGVRLDKKKIGDENAQRRLVAKSFEDLATNLGLELGDDDNVAESVQTFIADLQDQVKGGKEARINVDKANANAEKRVQEVTAAKDAELQKMLGALTKHLISDAATRALADSKGSVDLLLPHVQSRCKVVPTEDGGYSVQVRDDQGDARFNSSGGFMTVGDLVGEMKTQDSFARAFEPEQAPGNGTTPGSMNRSSIMSNPNQQPATMSPVEKIRAGLQKGQAVDGRGGSTSQ